MQDRSADICGDIFADISADMRADISADVFADISADIRQGDSLRASGVELIKGQPVTPLNSTLKG